MSESKYFQFFDLGKKFLEKKSYEDAQVAFLQASRELYEQANDTELDIDSRLRWLNRAKKVHAMADEMGKMSGKKKKSTTTLNSGAPQSGGFGGAGSPIPNDEKDGESRWELTERPDVRFSDIAGLAEVKDLIERRVLFPMRDPDMAHRYGRKIGAGIMMYGPPGTGKTMMAKAIAGELNAPFFSIQSSSILSKWVGDAEQNIKELFEEARKELPSVLFFDEAEALLATRGGDSTVMNRVIPEFLAQVDGVSSGSEGLLLIGATNRPWDIDPAAMRPGRFGEKIYVSLPDATAREFLLRRKLEKLPGGETLDYAKIAEMTNRFSGADINGLVNRIVDPVFDRAMETGRPVPVTPADVENALRQVRPSVSDSELLRYEKFAQSGE